MIRAFLLAVFFAPIAMAGSIDEVLPAGSAPQPIAFGHFPGRLQAVVWRNWQLVRPSILARVLGTNEDQVTQLAASMGLPPAGDVPAGLARRAYITVLRRNWHLLPYEQLLPLIGMSRAELAYSLREDDFLFIKMGNLKPRCSPVIYAEPDGAARARAAEIKAVVEAYFGDAIRRRGEPRFAFVDRIARVPEGFQPPPRRAGDGPRYLYSYFGSYGDPLADGAPDSYPDGLLARLSECGVNGVWLHVVLRQLAPGGIDFPEFGAGCERRLANLRKLVDRAHRFGIDMYLYVNEPRAMPEAFFARRPDMAGVREGDHRALCTSNPRVRDWMSNALAHVFREVPGVGGRVHDHGLGKPHELCLARPAGRMPALQKPEAGGDHCRGERRDRRGHSPGKPAGEGARLGLGLARLRRDRLAAQGRLADVGQRVVAADRARWGQEHRRRVLPLGARTRPARNGPLEAPPRARAEDGRQAPDQQRLGALGRALATRARPRLSTVRAWRSRRLTE